MKKVLLFVFVVSVVFVVGGCSRDSGGHGKSNTMKCGAGKCGAKMIDRESALEKKRADITAQMREDDPRRGCVVKAQSIEILYNCIRDPKTGKLTMEFGEGKNAAQ
ncbi:hypothetical protein KKE54_03505 [bacterium]|nr:hypothetical protein [bacterium]